MHATVVQEASRHQQPQSSQHLHDFRMIDQRYVQHTVETLIGRKIIADEVENGQTLKVDCKDGDLVVLLK
jgi:hypothetical protein